VGIHILLCRQTRCSHFWVGGTGLRAQVCVSKVRKLSIYTTATGNLRWKAFVIVPPTLSLLLGIEVVLVCLALHFVFESGVDFVAQTELKLAILLPQPPE
jgi:uncharacterized membrane protein YadS